jgi:SAM-dependent methyltransferase
MIPEREHIHAHFGTFRDLLSEKLFLTLIDDAESFSGSPFTLCRCSDLGGDAINLTEKVRSDLESARWIPESGTANLIVLAPADGRWLSLEMRLPIDPGHLAEIHFRFDRSFVESQVLEKTVSFLEGASNILRPEFGYAHQAVDEAAQGTTTSGGYQSLAGSERPDDLPDPETRPGRSTRVGKYLITCRWLNFFGDDLIAKIGAERLEEVPCERKRLENGVVLRLYEDPMAFDEPANREIQAKVRSHLQIDELAGTVGWELVERRSTGNQPAMPEEEDQPDDDPGTTDPGFSTSGLPIYPWAALYDVSIDGLEGETDFYTSQARMAAGRVLELGCGTGRLTIPVARTGVPVVGLESSPEFFPHIRVSLFSESATLRSRTTLLRGNIDEADLSEYAPFSAVFIPYRGVNRFEGPHALREILEKLRGLLMPGGTLAFNTFFPRLDEWDSPGQARAVLAHSGTNPATKCRFFIYDTIAVDAVAQRLAVTRRFDELNETGDVINQRYMELDLRYFFPDELSYLLELTGFDNEIYGTFNCDPLTSADQEIIVIAHRI